MKGNFRTELRKIRGKYFKNGGNSDDVLATF